MPLLTAQTHRYALVGALFGFCFPLGATLIDVLVLRGLSLTWSSVLDVQAAQPLHWIIDSAPVVLSLVASLAGRRQDRVISLHHEARAAQQQAAELAKFPDENPNPVLRFRRDSAPLYANHSGQQFLDTIRENGILPLAWRSVIQEVLNGQVTREMEVPWDDQTLSLIFTPVPEHDYVNVYGRDITQRKVAERDLRLAKETAEAASRAKSDFLAHMSHELRTPMNAILGYTQILAGAQDLPSERRELVKTIGQAGEHLLSLINDVLDISKIEAGHAELNATDFYLRRVIEGLSSMFDLRCRQKGLAWRVERHLPDEPVHGDEGKLRQVLINLLGNAVKFTDQGGVTLHVQSLRDGLYEFSVSDTGTGIETARHEEIFAPFQQDREGVLKGGTGLGLAIARRHVEIMDGQLQLESTVGSGSRFFFAIPLTTAHGVRTAAGTRGDWHRVRRLCHGQKISALVVDDVLTNRDLLRHILADIGVRVATVDSGELALEHVRGERPDIIFMDIRMPGIDGVETMRRLYDEHGERELKIVAVTASVLEHQRREHEAAGFDAFLGKPLRAEQLYACLAELVGAEFDYLEAAQEETGVSEVSPDWSTMSLPAAMISDILDAARNHSATDVRRQIDAMAALGDDEMKLATHLRELSQRFDMSAIREVMESIDASPDGQHIHPTTSADDTTEQTT